LDDEKDAKTLEAGFVVVGIILSLSMPFTFLPMIFLAVTYD
jgi:hypothetical protein